MSEIKENLRYTAEHEWVLAVEGQIVRIGVTDYAQVQLGDIVFVEFPEEGLEIEAGQSIGTIESVKTVSELYSPVAGTVTRVNSQLNDQPDLVNSAPYDEGWIVEVELAGSVEAAFSGLLTPEQYRSLTE